MRNPLSLIFLGLGWAIFSCDNGSSVDNSTCGAGMVMCGTVCMVEGTCLANLGGSPSVGTGGATTKPIDTSTITSPDCDDGQYATASGTLAAQYTGITIATGPSEKPSAKQYFLSTNWWGKYVDQSISYDGLSFTIHNPSNVSATANDPIGFPTLYIGNYSGHANAGSNLPKPVSQLTSVPTVFSTNAAEGKRDNYNATYDVWFTPTNEPLGSSQYSPPKGGAFLMVWLFLPTNRQPRGSISSYGHAVSGVDDLTWNVWIDKPADGSATCISYVSTRPIDGLAFDLNHFIQDSVNNKFGITSSMSLSVVFAGFEIWSGGEGLELKNFCAKVN
ncbi:MAG TPA: hypothetical protein VIV60_10570 [Polyangiaceae bacterium]